MSRIALARRLLNSATRTSAKGAAAIAVVSLAGCSADIGRFDFPSAAYTTRSGTTGSLPTPPEPMARRGAGLGSEDLAARPAPAPGPGPIVTTPPAPPARAAGTRVAGLHDPSRPPVIAAPPAAPPVSRAPVAHTAAGTTIEVKPGDTLSGIAHRHGASISELMAVNGLSSPAIKPGQRLTLPPSRRTPRSRSAVASRAAPSPAPAMISPATPGRGAPIAAAPAPSAAPEPAPATPGPRAAAEETGTYTVRSGDSLYAIARRHRVTLNQLQQANGISDPTKIKPGDLLKIPGAPSGTGPIARIAPRFTPAPVPPPAPPASPAAVSPPAPGTASLTAPSGTRLTVLNPDAASPAPPPPRVAALGDAVVPPIAVAPPAGEPPVSPAPPVAAISPAPIMPAPGASATSPAPIKFRWPAKGRVIGNFGARPDATHSDGIKISVPVGADVVAAEGGVVAYAGSELKGYGNLILIRHENNWVTAYAHNDELLVKRGDKVRRGQSIAKAGKTGNVEQPQLHFELRQGAKPVDPVPYLEPL